MRKWPTVVDKYKAHEIFLFGALAPRSIRLRWKTGWMAAKQIFGLVEPPLQLVAPGRCLI